MTRIWCRPRVLVPALRLAEAADLYDLLEALTAPSPNVVPKAACVVGGMIAGADESTA